MIDVTGQKIVHFADGNGADVEKWHGTSAEESCRFLFFANTGRRLLFYGKVYNKRVDINCLIWCFHFGLLGISRS